MRHSRIKIPPTESAAAYHCISRTVNGEWLFDDVAKEIFRKQLWRVADYCGVQVGTYTILSNHFHILVNVPQQTPVTDAELLRRFAVLYPKPTKYETEQLEVVKAELATNGPEAVAWRRRHLARMGDVSQYMKLLKGRFSIWFNQAHDRFGTLWAERFKSTLVEPTERLCQTMAAYIDLNCVRAGLVTDPKDYRFCGYAEAVAGSTAAQAGLRAVTGDRTWDEAQAHYREVLFGTGAGAKEAAATIPAADLERVIAQGGKLPLATVLRCRLRYFTDGAVLGSKVFVAAQLVIYRQKTGRRQRTAPRALPAWTDFGDWATLRSLRRPAFG